MNKQIMFIPGLFALGIVTGIVIMNSPTTNEPTEPVVAQNSQSSTLPEKKNQTSDIRIQTLENEVVTLKDRVDELESLLIEKSSEAGTKEKVQPGIANSPLNRMNPVLTVDKLVKSGIDPQLANDLIQRNHDIELRKLELRDKATREGYLGTSQYFEELAEINANDLSLRDELGDDAYDRYLYTNGQLNRVKIESVMLNSAAEQAGVFKGDIVLDYSGSNIFSWNELRNATTQGVRDEYTNLTVLRDGQQVNLWVQRGPLGVRMSQTRIDPDN